MDVSRSDSRKITMLSMLLYPLAFIIAGLFAGDIAEIPGGLADIFTCPAPLITDFSAVGGFNAALLNAGITGLMLFVLCGLTGIEISARVYGAFFLAMGMGLFGNTPVTTAPFILGGWLYSVLKREPLRRNILYPVLAAALSPAMSVPAFRSVPSFGHVAAGAAAAVAIGFVITPVAISVRAMFKGFDLYDVSLAAGLIGMVFFSVYRECVLLPKGLGDGYFLLNCAGRPRPGFVYPFLGGLFFVTALGGWLLSGRKFAPFLALRRHAGLGVDFISRYGMAAVLMNMGLSGLMILGYMAIINAPMNGVTAGALICVLCWTCRGANTRNLLPLLVGYGLFSLIVDKPLNAQYLCVSLCCGAGLAPLGDRYGGVYGIAAGAVHAFLSGVTAGIHGGFYLYNGGFSAAVTALVLLPLMHSPARHGYGGCGIDTCPSLVTELAADAAHIASSAAHLVEPDPEIVQNLPEDTRESKTVHTFLDIRNTLAVLACVVFILSILPGGALHARAHIMKFAAYLLGAVAYGAEIIVLTDGLRRDPGVRAMLMPYIFGVLYILLGLSYLVGAH